MRSVGVAHKITKQTGSIQITPELGRQTRVVLHQPLSLSIFRKKAKNGLKMNGVSVCLGQKTENAPTWRSPSPLFGGCFLVIFTPLFAPLTHQIYTAYLFYFYILHLNLTTR